MSNARTPALKNEPKMISSLCQDHGNGSFSCRLCGPNRPRRAAYSATGGSGRLPMISGARSSLTSASQTRLGWSAAWSCTLSSLITSRSRLGSGSTVWVNPVIGG